MGAVIPSKEGVAVTVGIATVTGRMAVTVGIATVTGRMAVTLGIAAVTMEIAIIVIRVNACCNLLCDVNWDIRCN